LCVCTEGWAGELCEIDTSDGLDEAIEDILGDARREIQTFAKGNQRDSEINTFLDTVSTMQSSLVAQKIQGIPDGMSDAHKAYETKKIMHEFGQVLSTEDFPVNLRRILLSTSAIKAVPLQPVLITAPPMRTPDTCASGIGANCPVMLVVDEVVISDGKQLLNIMETAPEANSWSLTFENPENPQLLTKQTRLEQSTKKYLMQCWSGTSWTKDEIFDVQNSAATYECNGHVLLIASVAGLCTPSTCSNGGTCGAVGFAFFCNCPAGYTGALCEIENSITHCSEYNCDNAGGHKKFNPESEGICSESDQCTTAKCCVSDPVSFYAECELAKTQPEVYITSGCCATC